MNLPNRELLLLRVVFALPNASRIGFAEDNEIVIVAQVLSIINN